MNDKRGVLRQLFDEFDLDKNGALETNELGLLLKVNCADVNIFMGISRGSNICLPCPKCPAGRVTCLFYLPLPK